VYTADNETDAQIPESSASPPLSPSPLTVPQSPLMPALQSQSLLATAEASLAAIAMMG